MADTTTINKGFVKPEINASIDTWGNKLNADLDQLDGYFELGGGLKLAQGGTGATTAAGARTNLGLGNGATRNVGTAAGTVAAGDLTVPRSPSHSVTNPDAAPEGSSGGDAGVFDGVVRGWNWLTRITSRGGTDNYASQIAVSDTGLLMLFRAKINGTWSAFRRVLTSSDIGEGMTGSLGLAVAPSERLDVSGSVCVRGNVVGPSTGHAYTLTANPNASFSAGGYIQIYGSTHAAPTQVIIGANGAGRLVVNSNNINCSLLTTVQHGSDVDSSSAHFRAGNTGRLLNILGRLAVGAYNPVVQAGDTGLITTGPTIDSTTLFIGAHASTANGVRITPTATILQGNAKLRQADGTEPDVGFRGAPVNYQPNAYTFALSDAGKTVVHNAGAGVANTYTIPTNAAVPLPLGTAIVVRNRPGTGAITLAPATGVTLRQAGNTATGARSVAANGLVTLLKEVADEWVVSGAGLS